MGLILMNEPDLVHPGSGAVGRMKLVLSALDGVLAAEQEAGVTAGRTRLTVSWSFATHQKRMVPRGYAKILGLDCFNDPAIARDVMYCGDWWNTSFLMNTTIAEVIGEKNVNTKRCQHLADVLQVDLSWTINSISDGQRRRCQLLELLVPYRPVYLMDEITSDLDIYAREGILGFLKAESEQRGCTIFYCTHIFDELEGWPDHQLRDEGCSTPLYSTIRRWIYAEYAES